MLDALRQALEPNKGGSKFKYPQRAPEENMEDLKEEIDRLRDCLEENPNLSAKRELEPRKNDSRPVRYPNCGRQKVHRNGIIR